MADNKAARHKALVEQLAASLSKSLPNNLAEAMPTSCAQAHDRTTGDALLCWVVTEIHEGTQDCYDTPEEFRAMARGLICRGIRDLGEVVSAI